MEFPSTASAINDPNRPMPRRGMRDQLRMSHASLNKRDMQKRYQTNMDDEIKDESKSLVEERKACFTENYLVFSLAEKLPQLTSIFLDKEDDVLDYCKTVNFNRNARRMQMISEGFTAVNPASSQYIPDEIDGDERGTMLFQKESSTVSSRNQSIRETSQFDAD